jgi:lipoprotein signal peptidase
VLPANERSLKRCNLSERKQRILYGCVLFFAIFDGIFKILATHSELPLVHSYIFSIGYFANPGIAFSIPLPQTFTLITTGTLIIGFSALLIQTKNSSLKIALTTAILGASSNFIDRLLTGYTTDYFIFFTRSAINIADILIIVGIGYCTWYYQKADVKL